MLWQNNVSRNTVFVNLQMLHFVYIVKHFVDKVNFKIDIAIKSLNI